MTTASAPDRAGTDADVIVVGAGPVGLMLANLLGRLGIRTTVLEREESIYEFPRAVGMDDETLRACQAAGLVKEVVADIVTNTAIRYYTSYGRCLAHIKPSQQPYGWPRRNLFLQPLFEQTLRTGLERFPHVDLLTAHSLADASQDDGGVTATVDTPTGRRTLRAPFMVGADGGRSTVRRLLGIELTGDTESVRWLVVDVADDELDAPYSAVYCHPENPVLMVPLPYRHRRFEFRLAAGEGEEEVTRAAHVESLLAPFYGQTPMPKVLRRRVYTHHGRVATRFGTGRIFLAGDAAHLQPPFFGQGMNSGIRDAANLAWKLAAVVDGHAAEALLATYDAERRPHAKTMVDFAVGIGRMYTPINHLTERVRDGFFRAIQLLPGIRDYILQMGYKPKPRFAEGAIVSRPVDGPNPVGAMLAQPEVEGPDGVRKLDDVIGPGFGIIGVGVDPTAGLNEQDVAWWLATGGRFVHVVPPRSGPPPGLEDRPLDARGSLVVEDISGVFREWRLSRPSQEVIVLRPDRYVAAVCPVKDLPEVTAAMRGVLEGRQDLSHA